MEQRPKRPFLPGVSTSNLSSTLRGLPVVSELVTFENKRGQRLVGFHDFLKGKGSSRLWMLVLPGYGETKTDVLSESYVLAKNGFHTLRFDYSDHVGESDGQIICTTLTKIKEDILSSLDYLHLNFQPEVVGAVSSSLASRALLRACREDDRLALLINLVSVVDLRKTLFAIYNRDYLERTVQGAVNGTMDVLGFQVDADNFLQSAIKDRYEDLTTTIDDVRHIKTSIVFLAAEKDTWVELNDVRLVFDAALNSQKKLYILKGAMHRLYENPEVAKEVLRAVVKHSSDYLSNVQRPFPIQQPSLKEIGARIRKEKDRTRLLHGVSKEEERAFWESYLEKYSFIINVHDYWNLLDFIYRLLGAPTSEGKILDAGCGIGTYGIFLLMKLMYRLQQNLILAPGSPYISYVGVDFVENAIICAKQNHGRVSTDFNHKLGLAPNNRLGVFSYSIADLESKLPFQDGTFDKICCNLVISYLSKPRRALADMMRVLKPKGRIVVTSLKPFADLSEIYRNFIRVAETPEEVEEAYKLLKNAGLVKAKEAEGIYRFFAEEELMNLLRRVGFSEVETYRSFGNQANVAVGTKD